MVHINIARQTASLRRILDPDLDGRCAAFSFALWGLSVNIGMLSCALQTEVLKHPTVHNRLQRTHHPGEDPTSFFWCMTVESLGSGSDRCSLSFLQSQFQKEHAPWHAQCHQHRD